MPLSGSAACPWLQPMSNEAGPHSLPARAHAWPTPGPLKHNLSGQDKSADSRASRRAVLHPLMSQGVSMEPRPWSLTTGWSLNLDLCWASH